MFSTPALAQIGDESTGGNDLLLQFAPIILIFLVFYFLLIRPEQKRRKAHKAKLEQISRGDDIILGGGIYGKVIRTDSSQEMQVEIAEGVRVRVLRSSVMDVAGRSAGSASGKDDTQEKKPRKSQTQEKKPRKSQKAQK